MPTVFFTTVNGDGLSTGTAYRPDTQAAFACLSVDPVRLRAVVIGPDTAPGEALVSGTDMASLRSNASSSGPNTPRRNAINALLTSAGYNALPAGTLTWVDVIHHIARQVNPVADLTAAGIS